MNIDSKCSIYMNINIDYMNILLYYTTLCCYNVKLMLV